MLTQLNPAHLNPALTVLLPQTTPTPLKWWTQGTPTKVVKFMYLTICAKILTAYGFPKPPQYHS